MSALCDANSGPGRDDRGRDSCLVAWPVALCRPLVPAGAHSCATGVRAGCNRKDRRHNGGFC